MRREGEGRGREEVGGGREDLPFETRFTSLPPYPPHPQPLGLHAKQNPKRICNIYSLKEHKWDPGWSLRQLCIKFPSSPTSWVSLYGSSHQRGSWQGVKDVERKRNTREWRVTRKRGGSIAQSRGPWKT